MVSCYVTRVYSQEDHCSVDNIDKWDCAPTEAACEEAGCCWVPVTQKGTELQRSFFEDSKNLL